MLSMENPCLHKLFLFKRKCFWLTFFSWSTKWDPSFPSFTFLNNIPNILAFCLFCCCKPALIEILFSYLSFVVLFFFASLITFSLQHNPPPTPSRLATLFNLICQPCMAQIRKDINIILLWGFYPHVSIECFVCGHVASEGLKGCHSLQPTLFIQSTFQNILSLFRLGAGEGDLQECLMATYIINKWAVGKMKGTKSFIKKIGLFRESFLKSQQTWFL